MDYREYSAKDFALDKEFQNWVLKADEGTSKFWIQWLRDNPGKEKEINKARELVQLARLSGDSEADETYLKIWNNIRGNANHELVTRRRNRYARVAAVFTGVIVLTAYLLFIRQAPLTEYSTAYGEIKKLTLPDGSSVTLNANSTLQIHDDFAERSDRVVFLRGEAFFEVVRTNDKRAFQVNARDGVTVQVLGTVFNVDAREGKAIEVFLQEGKVKINRGEENRTLAPGEMATVTSGDEFSVKLANAVEQNYKLGWKNGNFVFNDTPLSQIIYDLRDDYGLDIVVPDTSIYQKRITAKVSSRDVAVLFKVLSETLDIKIDQQGNRVVMSPG